MNVVMGDAPAIGDAMLASSQVPHNSTEYDYFCSMVLSL